MHEVKRVVSTGFWNDNDVLNSYSPEDKYFMLYLLTNPSTTQLGIYHLPIKRMVYDTGYSAETIKVLLERFEKKYKNIRYSEDTSEVAIRNFLKHSVIAGGKPVFDLLMKETEEVKDKSLLAYIAQIYPELNKNTNKTVFEYMNYLVSYLNDNDIHNDNDNDNDNDSPTHDSYHDSCHESITPPKKAKEVKHKYGQYENVLLTDIEYCRLASDYGIEKLSKAIEWFSAYIAEKGYKSKSHNLAMRRWVFNAVEEAEAKQKNSFKSKGGIDYEEMKNWI